MLKRTGELWTARLRHVPGIGTTAVGIKGAAFTGGGYIMSVLDTKGVFGVSILGKSGTRDRDIALAKLVESRR